MAGSAGVAGVLTVYGGITGRGYQVISPANNGDSKTTTTAVLTNTLTTLKTTLA